MKESLERATRASYVQAIESMSMDEVRSKRAECQALENALSYVRRLAQGRLDIVGAELARRRAGGDPADLSDLIGRLPDILADRTRPNVGPASARPPLDFSDDDADELIAEIDAIFSSADVGSLVSHDDQFLDDARERLAGYEQLTSARRHALHGIIDTLQAEITRRYRTGEATVDSLLN